MPGPNKYIEQVRMKSYLPGMAHFSSLEDPALWVWLDILFTLKRYQFYQLLHFSSPIVALKVLQKPPAFDLLKLNTPRGTKTTFINNYLTPNLGMTIWHKAFLCVSLLSFPGWQFLHHEFSCDQFLYPTPLQVPKSGRLHVSEYQSLMLSNTSGWSSYWGTYGWYRHTTRVLNRFLSRRWSPIK